MALWPSAARSSSRTTTTASKRRRAVGLLSVTVALTGTGALAAVPAAAAPSPAHQVVIAVRPTLPKGSTEVGPLSGTRMLTGAVALKPRDPAGLAALTRAVTTPGTTAYHHYLQPGQFRHLFAPTDATLSAVTGTLAASGLHVTAVASNGMVVDFRGTAAAAESAFHTGIADYHLASGRVAFSPTAAVTLPSTIAGAVQTVVGLSNVARPQPMLVHGKGQGIKLTRAGLSHASSAGSSSPTPLSNGPVACRAARGGDQQQGALDAQQIAHSYGLDGVYAAGDTGAGQTVAVFELEPYRTKDLHRFDKCFFGGPRAKTMVSNVTKISVDGGVQQGPGEGEAALDVQDVQAMAPGAKVEVYNAPGLTYGWIDDFNQIISDDTAQVVTASYGLCESLMETFPGIVAAENVIFQQAALQGQTVFASSGDTGSDECAGNGAFTPGAPLLSQSDPSTQPYVTSVGGTSIINDTEPPIERTWNDGAGFDAGGGGLSAVWSEPAWQRDSNVPGMNNATVIGQARATAARLGDTGDFCDASDPASCREVPDVSALADEFGGTQIVYTGFLIPIGGTSSSSPLWAGILADINASKDCAATNGVGFVSPELYSVASVPAEYAASFNDVTLGNNDEFGVTDGAFPASTGYDMATGLGTPEVAGRLTASGTSSPGLAHYLCAAAAAPTPTVSSVSPQAVPSDGSGSFTITGSGFGNGATNTVAGITLNSFAVPSSDYTVTSPTTITVHGVTASQLAGIGTGLTGAGVADVTVTAVGGATSRPTPAARVIFVDKDSGGDPTPTVAGVSPPAGNDAGGIVVHVYGSGFTAATSVTFGGTPGTAMKVINDSQIDVTTPGYQPSTDCLNGEDPTTDICQTQVVVHTPTSTSSTDTSSILPEAEGTSAPPTGDEAVQAPTEFDFLPTPTITGLTLDTGLPMASEEGGDPVTLTGKGLGPLGLMWLNLGDPTKWEHEDFEYAGGNGTSATFYLNGTKPTITEFTGEVTLQTEGSLNLTGDGLSTQAPSNSFPVQFAPTPVVKSATTGSTYNAGPDVGGTPLTVTGKGFTDPTDFVIFEDIGYSGASSATEYDVTANADGTQLSLKTPADSPSRNVVVVCGISGCSAGGRGDTFTYFQPGDPVVTGIKPLHGPRGGKVEITGTNLGFVRKVLFGGVPGKAIGNPFQSLDQGDPDHVVAKAPAGKIGTTVPVRVATLESEVEHPADPLTPVNSAITYTYRKANTQVGLTLTPNPPVAGQADKITAGVAVPRGSTRAVGRVQFSDNGAVFATRPLPPSDQITVKHRFTAGRHTVTATFLGTRTLLRSHLTKKVLAAH